MASKLDEKVKRGDLAAFKRFYRKYQPRLKAIVSSKVSNSADVEEIVQDAFINFLDALPLYQGKAKLYTYLVSIAKHEVADYYRKKYAKKALKYVPFIDKGYTQDLFTNHETRQAVNQTLNQLLPEQRRLIIWKYQENLSVKKIADQLDVSIKAAESRLFRARKAFQLAYLDNINQTD